MICTILLLSVLFFGIHLSFGQEVEKKALTIGDVLLLPSWRDFRWSYNGTFIAYTRDDIDRENYNRTSHIWIYSVPSGETYQLTNTPSGESGPHWLPDGRLLFNSEREGIEKVYVISPSGGEASRYYDDETAPVTGVFSNDHSKIAYTERDESPDKKEREKLAEEGYDSYQWDADQTEFIQIWIYDLAAKSHTKITSGPYNCSGPRWSPNDRLVAFTSNRSETGSDENDNSDIWTVPSAGGDISRVTTNPGPDQSPVWSPDGRFIAYQSSGYENHQADHLELTVIYASGGEPVNLTENFDYSVGGTGDGNPGWLPVWSPDGNSVYMAPFQETSRSLYRLSAGGGKEEEVLSDDNYLFSDFQLSKDGSTWLFEGSSATSPGDAFIADRGGKTIRHIMSLSDTMTDYRTARQEAVVWKGADGWDIDGLLTYPLNYDEGNRYPAILMVHGGPDGLYTKRFHASSQLWAARGYAVLRGNPRGSSGHSFKFGMGNFKDWGGKDFQDLMNGVDYIIGRGIADPEHLAIMGGSYGGFMTFWTITQTNRFAAAIGSAAISNWFSLYAQTETGYAEFGFDGTPYEVRNLYDKFSPVNHVSSVTTPLLIIHGDEDQVVPVGQAVEYYTALKKHGKTVKFVRFPRERHGIREPIHRITLDKEQSEWLETYLK